MWTRFYGGSGYENPKAIEPLADGNFVIAGYSSSFGSLAGEGFALKIGLDGDTLWTRHYGGEGEQDFAAVTPLTDGGFVFAGYTTPQDLPGADVYVVRTDAAGDTLWTRRYGTPNVQDQAAGVQPMADGGFLVGGFTQATANSEADFLAISISATGAPRWSHTYGGSGWDRAYAVQRATDGNFVLAGITHSFGAGNHDGYLIKVDGDGDTLWTVTCGGPGNEYLYSLEVTHDGGYIVAGFTNSFGWGGSDGYVVRYPGFSGVGGFVHDETTGDPLPNVWVSAIGQTQSALTDAAGHYVLTLPPDTTFDIITYGQCTENDTVWNVAIFEDSIAALDLTVGRPHGIVTQSSLNIIAPNHQSGVDTLFISNTGPGILDFRVVARALAPPSPWLSVLPEHGSVPPNSTFGVVVTAHADTTDDGTYDYYGDVTVHMNSCPDSIKHLDVIAVFLDADDPGEALPNRFALDAYPNPFNPSTTLTFTLPTSEPAELTIYDVTGREVETIVRAPLAAGRHQFMFNASSRASGIYFVRLQTPSAMLMHKLLLLK